MKFEVVKNSIKFAAFVAEDGGFKGMRNFTLKVNPADVDSTMKVLNQGIATCV
jgi:Zn-dependent M28 family amino/carboxypeptidase